MQANCYYYLRSSPEIANFVRANPVWYRLLTREPSMMKELPQEVKVYYGKTWPQKIEKLNDHLQMFDMIIQMIGVMKD